MKKIFTIAFMLLILSGCSEKEEPTKKEPLSKGSIEVKEDKDAYEQKVKRSADTNDSAYYYSYNKKEEKKSALEANIEIKNSYAEKRAKMSKNFILKCAACHGSDGEGIIGKKLAGLSKEEAYKKLMEFKRGEKQNDVMNELLMNIDEDELKELSAEIGELKKERQSGQIPQ